MLQEKYECPHVHNGMATTHDSTSRNRAVHDEVWRQVPFSFLGRVCAEVGLGSPSAISYAQHTWRGGEARNEGYLVESTAIMGLVPMNVEFELLPEPWRVLSSTAR